MIYSPSNACILIYYTMYTKKLLDCPSDYCNRGEKIPALPVKCRKYFLVSYTIVMFRKSTFHIAYLFGSIVVSHVCIRNFFKKRSVLSNPTDTAKVVATF